MMIFPLVLSLLQGFFLLIAIFPPSERPRMPLLLFLGALIGMGTTALLTFTSFLFFNQLLPGYVIALNCTVTLFLFFLAKHKGIPFPFTLNAWNKQDLIGLFFLILFHIPVFLYAAAYPHGGWDAWSCWNLKAKFLFLGGDGWRGMMDPALWRSNISYPFLLPLVNVWAWCFTGEPSQATPMATSCQISLLMSGILFFGLKEINKTLSSLLAPLWALSVMFMVILASSQYSDLLTGTWLLSALLAFKLFIERRSNSYLSILLLSLGFMSFTKSEGLVLSLITALMCAAAILRSPSLRKIVASSWKVPLFALILSFLPTLFFQTLWAPDSRTFINGLTTATQPILMERLYATFIYLGIELKHPKWNGFWFILAGGILLSGTRAYRKTLWVIPAIIGSYILSLICVYTINTFFPVLWWLSTTLNRLLFALVPALIFWLFAAIDNNDPKFK